MTVEMTCQVYMGKCEDGWRKTHETAVVDGRLVIVRFGVEISARKRNYRLEKMTERKE